MKAAEEEAEMSSAIKNKLFIGPAGTITRPHRDTFAMHVWLTQVTAAMICFVLSQISMLFDPLSFLPLSSVCHEERNRESRNEKSRESIKDAVHTAESSTTYRGTHTLVESNSHNLFRFVLLSIDSNFFSAHRKAEVS